MRRSKQSESAWVVTARSESGDDYGALLFRHKPSDDDLEEFLRGYAPGEWDGNDGPGFRGSYLHISRPELLPIRDIE